MPVYTYQYTTARDIEPWIMKYLRHYVTGVSFKLEAPTEQTTTYAQPTCYIYTQARSDRDRVTDRATIGLAYFQGASETTTQAFENMAQIVGIATADIIYLKECSPIAVPIRDETNEFTLAESATATHAKPCYYATVTYLCAKKVREIEM